MTVYPLCNLLTLSGAVGAEDAAASLSKIFLGKID